MAEPTRALWDTSVVIDHDILDPACAANGLPLYTRNPADVVPL